MRGENGADMIWNPTSSYADSHYNPILGGKHYIYVMGNELGGGTDGDVSGDILHPNCKCTLQIYTRYTDIKKVDYTHAEQEEQYHIRQKVNSLTLQKERIKTDMKIQAQLGNIDEVDKLNQKRNKINAKIRDYKQELPTEELQKQVVAINRNY